MPHTQSYWADVVAELANRREPIWRDRLGRSVDYPLPKMREIAVAATRAGTLGDEFAMGVVQSGLQAIEMVWQLEYAVRTNVAGHA